MGVWPVEYLTCYRNSKGFYGAVHGEQEALLLQRDHATCLSVEILQLRIIHMKKIAIDK